MRRRSARAVPWRAPLRLGVEGAIGASTPDQGDGVDVGAWLRGLGFGQYEQVFRDNDVDAGVLPTLTADDLRELGGASLRHRKRLPPATAASPARPGPRAPAPPAPALPPAPA